MPRIEFDKTTRETLTRLLTHHLRAEHDVELEPFDALAFLDWLSETLGPHYYNQGLHDAQAIVQKRVDGIIEAVYEIEKPVKR